MISLENMSVPVSKKMKDKDKFMKVIPHLFCILALTFVLSSCGSEQKADLVLRNGTIYTLDENNPQAGMVAVRGDRIVFVGSDEEAVSWVGEQTEVIDLQGKTMTPGFIEGHGHFIEMGQAKTKLDLSGARNYTEVVTLVAEAVDKTDPGEWIIGYGWHQSNWNKKPVPEVQGFQTHEALSAVSSQNPVFLLHTTGHAAMVNLKAMELAGISRDTIYEADGEVIKDEHGNPTGILVENAMVLVSSILPEANEESLGRAVDAAMDESLRNGITTFQYAGANRENTGILLKYLNEGKLKVRLWLMLESLTSEDAFLQEWYERGPAIGLNDNFLTVRSIKIYADGAIGSRGAWLIEEYADRPGHFGHETVPMEEVYQISTDALKYGFQVATHAIGDRTNREVLNIYERVFQENPEKARDARFRIEHAQHLDEKDIPRFGELGVIASMQGNFTPYVRPWAVDRLGLDRIREGTYVARKLLSTGAVIVNGSDVPVVGINPIISFYGSVTRQTLDGDPPGGFEPEQKMTRLETLRSYTLDAAFGGFEEDIKGSIEVGKLADFTVFSQDLLQVPDSEILNTVVEYTIVGGKVLFQREK
ncbi:amidohydrolase [Emcibacter sp.]|uniref:amidohydrolase n=1 Tax=Emcibacter sp. TaxID=1979954 RepID=UPI002AA89A74|nr:amidohydrolase [Emcibacter sp.]